MWNSYGDFQCVLYLWHTNMATVNYMHLLDVKLFWTFKFNLIMMCLCMNDAPSEIKMKYCITNSKTTWCDVNFKALVYTYVLNTSYTNHVKVNSTRFFGLNMFNNVWCVLNYNALGHFIVKNIKAFMQLKHIDVKTSINTFDHPPPL